MRVTTQDNWRVVATVHPRWTHMPIASLGFTDVWGQPLSGQVWGEPFEITVVPEGPGFKNIGDFTFTQAHSGREGCEIIRKGLLKHPNVVGARIECDEEHRCSHCQCLWEELDNASEVAEFGCSDGFSMIGEPVCCTAAVNEFRAGWGIPLLDD